MIASRETSRPGRKIGAIPSKEREIQKQQHVTLKRIAELFCSVRILPADIGNDPGKVPLRPSGYFKLALHGGGGLPSPISDAVIFRAISKISCMSRGPTRPASTSSIPS
jgi:hypothetical protein